MKKKCKLVVLASDSKLAIGSNIRDKDRIDLLSLFGMISEDARNTVRAIQVNINVLKKKNTCAALSSGKTDTTLPALRPITSK